MRSDFADLCLTTWLRRRELHKLASCLEFLNPHTTLDSGRLRLGAILGALFQRLGLLEIGPRYRCASLSLAI